MSTVVSANCSPRQPLLNICKGSFVWREEFLVPVTDVPASSPMVWS
jgi:hypothetical protein